SSAMRSSPLERGLIEALDERTSPEGTDERGSTRDGAGDTSTLAWGKTDVAAASNAASGSSVVPSAGVRRERPAGTSRTMAFGGSLSGPMPGGKLTGSDAISTSGADDGIRLGGSDAKVATAATLSMLWLYGAP